MTVKAGKNAGIKYGCGGTVAAPTGGTDISTYCDSIDLARAIAMIDTTTMAAAGSTGVAETFLPGTSTASLKVSGVYDTALESSASLESNYQAGTAAIVKFTYDTTTDAFTASATKPIYAASCYVKSFNVKVGVKGADTFDAELQWTGAYSRIIATSTW